MKLKSLLFIASASACLAAFAYTWTGGANDGGLWTTPQNWGVTSGYPQAADDPVIFNGDATVSLNTGAQTDIAYINVKAGNVVLTATSGSSLKLNWPGHNNPDSSVTLQSGCGIAVSEGASLDLSAPLAEVSGRFDRQGTGKLTIRDITVSKQDTASWYVFNGTNEFVGTAFVNQPNADFTVGLGTPQDRSFVFIKDSARITAKLFSTSAGGNPVPDTKIIQDGAATVVSVSTRLDLRNNSGNDGHCYTLKSGTLSAGELQIAPNYTAAANYSPKHLHYIQEGGTSTFSTVTLTRGSAALRGGVMNLPTLSAITTDGGCALNLEGGTLALTAETLSAWDWSAPKFNYSPSVSVAIVGTSSLSIPRSCSTYDLGLEIGAGKTVTVADGATITAPLCSTNVWKVTLDDGAVLKLASRTARVFVPLDLAVNGSGKVQMYNSNSGYGGGSRGTVVAHRLVVDGVEKAKGRYTAAASDFLEAGTAASVKGAASILVPTVWTGAGGDTLWSNPANWDNNTVPNGSADIADISRAETVTLDQDVTLNALVAMPNGIERKVTITGSYTINLHSSAGYQCNIFLPEGCELVLDANLTRDSNNVHGVYGGGKLTVKKTFPGCTSGLVPYMAVDGTLAFAGTAANIANIPTSNYAFLSLWSYEAGEGNVLFEDGTVFSAARLWNGANDYVQAYDFRQTGGNVTFSTFYLNNGNTTTTRPPCYYLEGGSLTVNANINLGRSLGTTDTRKRFPGGSFEMSGGTLDCQGFSGARNQNYVTLYGGTVYLKGNFTAVADSATQTNRNDYTYYLGGVTIRPTGNYRTFDSGNIYFTGRNGDTVFDMTDYIVAVMGGTIAGPGGFVMSGPNGKTATLKGTYTNTGTIRVTGGVKVDIQTATLNGPTKFVVDHAQSVLNIYSASGGNACTILKSPDVIVLAAESCLALSGQSITVKRFVVGGAEYVAGTYSVCGGTVTVASHPDSWLNGTVGDLSYKVNGTTTTVDAATSLSSLTYAPLAAAETNALAGAALTFEDGANIHVEKGDTLVINNDVVLGGKVTKTGWGEVVFNGAVTSAVTPTADTDSYWLTVTEGYATFDGAVQGVRLVTCGSIDADDPPVIALKENCTVSNYAMVLTAWNEGSAACRGETHQLGATVDYSTTIFDTLIYNRSAYALTQPRAGGFGRYVLDSGELIGSSYFNLSFVFSSSVKGEFEFVQNGGRFVVPKNMMYARDAGGIKFTYTLNGGRFEFGGYVIAYANPKLSILNLNGGTYVAGGSDAIKRESFTFTMSGTNTFEIAEGKTLTLANDATGASSIVKKGAGTLALDGMIGIGGLDVQDGTATICDKIPPLLDGTADLSLSRTAVLNLDYDGQATFKTLTVGGRGRGAGVYSATQGPSAVKRVLAGDGELLILEGTEPGTIIYIR